MDHVKPKKHLGQHFLKDQAIAQGIVQALTGHKGYAKVVEIGPGMGVLTDYLLEPYKNNLYLIDVDAESVVYLHQKYPDLGSFIIEADFLKADLRSLFSEPVAVIGNFPYNISSQILFKILEHRQAVMEVVGMFQKEVAERIASGPGNKQYGILSVLLQAYYDIEYLFTVEPEVFQPPPKVRSGVIRLIRNEKFSLDCDEVLFKQLLKQGFQNRRKTLRNALKPVNLPEEVIRMPLLDQRAEQLSVADFVHLTQKTKAYWKQ